MERTGSRWRVLLATAAVALLGVAAPAAAQDDGSSTSSSTVPPPETTTTVGPPDPVTGPLPVDAGTRGGPVTAALEPLAELGYQEQEVLLAGTATLHTARGQWGSDGTWAVSPAGTSPFRTRLLVRRPVDPERFSGTVFVSWLNVNGAFDADPDWAQIGEEVVRQGAAWVGVSAQGLGVEGPLGAKAFDPQRYGSLRLVGDAPSYDVLTQAAAAIRRPSGTDPLGGLGRDRRLVAVGQSQSAQRMVTYANAFQPTTRAFDGFLLISRFRGAAPLGSALLPSSQAIDPDGSDGRPFLPDPIAALLSGPTLAKVRGDLDVPVFTVITETEARQARAVAQPDGDRFRTWEVAGSAHSDATVAASLVAKLRRDFPQVPTGQLECAGRNAFPTRYALRSAARAMATWVRSGTAPAVAPPIERDARGGLVRDADGNVRGGLRLPDIDVPIARHTGESDRVGYCGLAGATAPFSAAQLAQRYPTPEAYVAALTAAMRRAIDAGFLLADDAAQLLDVTPVPGSDATAAAIAATTGDAALTLPAGPSTPGAAAGPGAAATDAGVQAASGSEPQGWMATTGRDLITPLLVGLLLLLNGRVVLTIAGQRRRTGSG